jgi:nondiscriminating glutamyl-tRNA synthetase
MHLGNVRTALINYLYARQKGGKCIIRIEDTDPQRNFDPGGKKIMEDLTWLGITYDEGPDLGGPYGPYIQSQRGAFYAERLQYLIQHNFVYRCFCTPEELEKKRQRQISLKMPPRYDRTCLKLDEASLKERISRNDPYIWRLKLDQDKSIIIQDMAHDTVVFQLKNFSDFPITRKDGSFTFMFTNCVDDMAMKITHIFRGEDHLTNTAGQAALFEAFDVPLPMYWHMPILCNTEGKKLSKRDFGFALTDLRQTGYLPEAICNYLGIIGGGSFKNEIMTLKELEQTLSFENIKTTGHVRYDTEKLTWINHKWITAYPAEKLSELCLPFLQKIYPSVKTLDKSLLTQFIQLVKADIYTLKDVVQVLHFYFVAPEITTHELENLLPDVAIPQISQFIISHLDKLEKGNEFIESIKRDAKELSIPMKHIFHCIRLGLTGQTDGPALHDLIAILGAQQTRERLTRLLSPYID